MTVTECHERLRILLHDKGLGYVVPHPFWTPEVLTQKLQAALDVLYTTLVERAELTGTVLAVGNRMIKTATATAGTPVPNDFYHIIIGLKANGKTYVNADKLPIAGASTNAAFETVYAAAGVFRGTAASVYYYAKPTGPVDPGSPDMTDFPDGFYDTMITLAAIEVIMGEQSDGADRLDVLYELFQDQLGSLK